MKHSICLFVFCTLLSSIGYAKNNDKYLTKHRFSQKNFVDTIPIDFQGNRIIVPVEINGRSRLFMLDTGCGCGGINIDNDLALKPIGKAEVNDIHDRSKDIDLVSLPDLKIGNLTVKKYHAIVVQALPGSECMELEGILGFSLFKNLSAKIDTRNKQLILTDRKGFFDSEQSYDLDYQIHGGIPMVLVQSLGGIPELVGIDTGDTSFYNLGNKSGHYTFFCQELDMKQYIKDKAHGSSSAGVFGQGSDMEVLNLQWDEVKWGAYSFKNPTSVTREEGNSSMGADILNYGALIINTHRQQMSFLPFNEGDSCTVDDAPGDIYFDVTGDNIVISLVWEKSEAFQLGIRKGDILQEVDGKAIHDICTFLRLLHETKGKKIRLLLKSAEGEIKDVIYHAK